MSHGVWSLTSKGEEHTLLPGLASGAQVAGLPNIHFRLRSIAGTTIVKGHASAGSTSYDLEPVKLVAGQTVDLVVWRLSVLSADGSASGTYEVIR